MKATGIVRRIDDLGRVVIPKEIRRTMRIREGEPLEIYTDHEGEVIFKKYSPIGGLMEMATQYVDILNKTCNLSIAVVDRDVVVACAGVSKKDVLEHKITAEVEKMIEDRQLYIAKGDDGRMPFIQGGEKYYVRALMPIFAEGDITGAVALLSSEDMTPVSDMESKSIQTAAAFLGRQLEA
ncbi:MAG: stage V sporulation T C-terminal domain-containing protein [Eubacteriales bacterium]